MNIWEALYDALCRRSCRFLVFRTEVGERSTTSSELIRSTLEIVDLNREGSSHSLEPVEEFETGDHVFLKVIPKRGWSGSASKESYRRGISSPSRYSRGWVQ